MALGARLVGTIVIATTLVGWLYGGTGYGKGTANVAVRTFCGNTVRLALLHDFN